MNKLPDITHHHLCEADILAMAEMIAEAEELDKASSDLCGMPWAAVVRETGCCQSVSA